MAKPIDNGDYQPPQESGRREILVIKTKPSLIGIRAVILSRCSPPVVARWGRAMLRYSALRGWIVFKLNLNGKNRLIIGILSPRFKKRRGD